nr:hypothetical protein [Tanacetum cinerariifolium]
MDRWSERGLGLLRVIYQVLAVVPSGRLSLCLNTSVFLSFRVLPLCKELWSSPIIRRNDGEPNILNDGNRSASHSPHGLVSKSVHHFVNIEEKRDQESPPKVKPFVNLSGQSIQPTKEPMFLYESNVDRWSHLLNNLSTGDPTSQSREIITGRNIKEGKSSRSASMFENLLADYDALAETHSECSETVQKLMDARLDLEHNTKLYTDAMNRDKTVKEEHAGCGQRI